MALIDSSQVTAWLGGSWSDLDAGALSICVDAAISDVEAETGRKNLRALAAVTLFYDGDNLRDRILLPPEYNPIQAVVEIRENGSLLTFAQGYSTSADVIVKNLLDPHQPTELIRRTRSTTAPLGATTSWAAGIQNVQVDCLAGWDDGQYPGVLVQAAIELAADYFKEARRAGLVSGTAAGGRAQVNRRPLPDRLKVALRRYQVWR